MASTIAGGLHKAQEVVQKTASKDKKLVDLERDTANIHTKQALTTDHGVRINDTDHWLRAVDDNYTGPSLLEDQIAREKVCRLFVTQWYIPVEWILLISLDPTLRSWAYPRESCSCSRNWRVRQLQTYPKCRRCHSGRGPNRYEQKHAGICTVLYGPGK